MANTLSPYSFQFYGSISGQAAIAARGKTLSNVTLKVGDPIVRTGGYIKLAGTTSTALFGVAIEAVTGVAATRNSVAYIPAAKDYIWSAQVKSTCNITQGHLSKKLGIAGTTNGKIGISTTATTSTLQIVGLKGSSALSTYAELLFVICKSSFENT